MGQKVHPKAFRLKINKTWDSRWFSNAKDFADFLKQDIQIRKYILNKLTSAGVSKVDIERSANTININIRAAKPGIIIGRGGAGAEDLKKEIHNKFLKTAFARSKNLRNINVNIISIENVGIDAAIIMQQVVLDLEKRIPFRRSAKQAIGRAEKAGAKGIKIIIAGRLNGAEIARSETFFTGKIPLHTLRADIDYSRGAAHTVYGLIGVKVWVYKGEIFDKKNSDSQIESSNQDKIVK